MQKKGLSCSLGLLMMFCVSLGFAGNRPGAFTVTVADAYYHFDHKRQLANADYPNVSLAYNASPCWAMEISAGFFNTDQDASVGGDGVHGNLYSFHGIYRFAPYRQLEAYLLGGVGMLVLVPNGLDSEHPGNIDLGVGAQLFFAPGAALRVEARDVFQTTGSSRNDYLLNVGVSFLFGGDKVLHGK